MKWTEAFDVGSRYAVKRFAIKLGLVGYCAFAQSWTPWGFGGALLALAIFSALADILLAICLRERLSLRALGYWDEASVFIVIGLVTLLYLRG